ncbi:winged helix-turn-helix transcriptional regulator [Streptomyces lasiicapitis]|uniref:Transcriptional regulator n=1 Tax=Streptomyces lasiicapitis TaxID=1923961 RepID=A0ABQ2LLY2_9ACTN|nr:helix-turn-helix domain-containing protein [Streptomyces lasiicapitis]GGO39805.1 transcriptional regulator [Streptomyces lasiicapitis]
MPPRQRRSYDQYCAAARALDAVGDRWTLLIVRELLAGPRRYTDLHADLPGVSTDVLASRLKDMEQVGLASRRRLAPPASSYVYELTDRGRELLPVLRALAAWGAPELAERRPTDAVRAHWFALPLLGALGSSSEEGLLEVRLDEGEFHVWVRGGGEVSYGDGPAPGEVDAWVTLDAGTAVAVSRGELSFAEGVRGGRIVVVGEGAVAKVLREG